MRVDEFNQLVRLRVEKNHSLSAIQAVIEAANTLLEGALYRAIDATPDSDALILDFLGMPSPSS